MPASVTQEGRRVVKAPFRWNGKNKKGFISAVGARLTPALKQEVVIHIPHGKNEEPVEDSKFHIWIWSSPEGESNHVTPATMWGVKVDCKDKSFTLTRGVPIEDNMGYVVAELVGENNLYIFHDICHCGTPQEITIFTRILVEVLMLRTLDPAEQEANKKARKIEILRYAQECCIEDPERYFQSLKPKIRKGSLKELEQEISASSQDLMKTVDMEISAKNRLNDVGQFEESFKDTCNRELEAILNLPHVQSVEIDTGRHALKVFTDELSLKWRGRTYALGEFRIDIYFKERKVRLHNLTRKFGDMDAAHVRNGKPCLGNIQNLIPQCISEYQISTVVAMSIKFLESVNDDDVWGKRFLERERGRR